MKLPSGRKLEGYRDLKPEAVAGGSYAQNLFYVRDSQRDILYLARLLEGKGIIDKIHQRIAEENRDRGDA